MLCDYLAPGVYEKDTSMSGRKRDECFRLRADNSNNNSIAPMGELEYYNLKAGEC